jgi:hypothetical protein
MLVEPGAVEAPVQRVDVLGGLTMNIAALLDLFEHWCWARSRPCVPCHRARRTPH